MWTDMNTDHRLLDLPFSPVFYKLLLGQPVGMADLILLDPQLGRTATRLLDIARKYRSLPDISVITIS